MFSRHRRFRRSWAPVVVIAGILTIPSVAQAAAVPSYDFASPVFGMTSAHDGTLLLADAGAGIVQLGKGGGELIAELPGVTDVSPINPHAMFAVTGGGPGATDGKLFRVANGRTRQIADLSGFEADVNPDGGEIDSNPFGVATLTKKKALVADAGGNDLLIVKRSGRINWIASLPDELVSTDNVKSVVGCPDPAVGFEDICDLPDSMPAQAVATSVAIGPDGAYYVSELKGFPAPTGESRIWRIEPGTRHAECGTSPACSVVADGFTSIVDLSFHGNTLYVVELDETSWFPVESGLPSPGGTVNTCNATTWSCHEIATELPIPMAAAVANGGTVYVLILALVPGEAKVIALP
jgi:hypothetical protein